MDDVKSSDLKTILHSKRANLYYLERCRVLVNGGRVEYVTDEGQSSMYWNIPIANTTAIMLGNGTSITQAAMRELAKAGVIVGFCGGGGTPLLAANEVQIDVSWLNPQSEYRPTEYLQQWVKFWFDDKKRVMAAKAFQGVRLTQIERHWLGPTPRDGKRLSVDPARLMALVTKAHAALERCRTTEDILLSEASLTKDLYKLIAETVGYGEFSRAKRGIGGDAANRFLDHGNYLAYGLGAVAAWVLGLPHGLAVLHGKTRRGGLVFDIADLIKDALVLPQAFIAAMAGDEERDFRARCLAEFQRAQALDVMIDTIKAVAIRANEVS